MNIQELIHSNKIDLEISVGGLWRQARILEARYDHTAYSPHPLGYARFVLMDTPAVTAPEVVEMKADEIHTRVRIPVADRLLTGHEIERLAVESSAESHHRVSVPISEFKALCRTARTVSGGDEEINKLRAQLKVAAEACERHKKEALDRADILAKIGRTLQGAKIFHSCGLAAGVEILAKDLVEIRERSLAAMQRRDIENQRVQADLEAVQRSAKSWEEGCRRQAAESNALRAELESRQVLVDESSAALAESNRGLRADVKRLEAAQIQINWRAQIPNAVFNELSVLLEEIERRADRGSAALREDLGLWRARVRSVVSHLHGAQ